MAIINFKITKPLEKKIMETIKRQGFNSTAEFFRFAAMQFIEKNDPVVSDDDKLAYLTNELEKTLNAKLGNKKLPSLEKQISSIK